MKLVIPMAGRGTRLRPHTHTTPKPLLPIAGEMMIERIVKTFKKTLDSEITEIAFVLGDFGDEVKKRLAEMAERQGAKPSFYTQDVAMGTAHAVYCAAPSLEGEVIVAFADTLFDSYKKVSVDDADCVIWLKQVEDPTRFGVAVMDGKRISGFVEKPDEPISDLAIIGVYYFRKGEDLRRELQHIMDNDLKSSRGEYELTDAIDALLQQGNVFLPATVDEWLDCGTIRAWQETTNAVLEKEKFSYDATKYPGTKITPPCYIGENVKLKNAEIGPFVSIESGASVTDSTVSNTIINTDATITGSELDDATIGTNATVSGAKGSMHIGDDSQVNAKHA